MISSSFERVLDACITANGKILCLLVDSQIQNQNALSVRIYNDNLTLEEERLLIVDCKKQEITLGSVLDSYSVILYNPNSSAIYYSRNYSVSTGSNVLMKTLTSVVEPTEFVWNGGFFEFVVFGRDKLEVFDVCGNVLYSNFIGELKVNPGFSKLQSGQMLVLEKNNFTILNRKPVANRIFYLDFSMFESATNWIGFLSNASECLTAVELLGSQFSEFEILQLIRKTVKILEKQNVHETSEVEIDRLVSVLQNLELEALKNLKIDLYNLKHFPGVREILSRRCLPESSKFSYNQGLDMMSFMKDGQMAAVQAGRNSGDIDGLRRVIAREF